MTDVADRVVYSRSGFTYQATQLEQNGYVERVRDPNDERGTLVAITAKGRALVADLLPAHEDVVRTMLLDHLSPRDVAPLSSTLTRVRDQMRARPPRSASPRRRNRPTVC